MNKAALARGNRHHGRKAAAERVAGGSIGLGWLLVVVGLVLMAVLMWLVWR